MEFNVNIRHALIIALGTSPRCRDVIDKIYKEDEQRYYEIYIKSKFFDDMLKRLFSLKTEETINKLIGIVESCYIDGNTIKIEKIIREFNPSIVNFAKNSSVVDIDKFRVKYLFDKVEEFSEPELFTYYVSLMYLAYIKKKGFTGYVSIDFVKQYWDGYTRTMALNHFRHDLDFAGKDYTNEIGSLYKTFNLEPFETIKENKLELFLENFIEKVVTDKVAEKTGINDFSLVPVEIYQDIRNKSFTDGILKYIGSFSRFFDTLGLEKLEIFQEVNFDNNELNMIFREFLMGMEGNNIAESERDLYIVACIYIYNLAELYKEAKELYLNKSKEEKYRDLKVLENKIEKTEEYFKEKESKLSKELSKKDEEIKKLRELLKNSEKENRNLKTEISKTNKTIDDIELSNKELLDENNMLVNMISSLEDDKKVEISLEEKIEYINNYKIALFGGHKAVDNLSEVLNNVTFYKELNRDITSIKNSYMAFVMTDFFNHAFSKKISSLATKYDIPVRGIRGTNIDSIIEDIYRNLKNIEK